YSLGPAGGAKVKQRQAEILKAIRTAGPIGSKELQQDLEVNKATLQRDLKGMKKNGQIDAMEEAMPRGGKRFLYVVSDRRLTPLKGGVSETTRHLTLDSEE
ncbi:MAG: HTH domain-containing protein, partial [Actinomycetota bacterium]